MSSTEPIIVVGAGLAGYGVIRELRKLNGEVPLTLITADEGHFYSKPRLSTHLSSGRSLDTLVTTSAEEMAQKNNFCLLSHHTVESVDIQRQVVKTQHGEHGYSKLVLAVGAVPRQPNYLITSAKIFTINQLNDYLQLAPLLVDKKRILIYGGGLVACEFANDLALAGHSVHLVTRALALLDRIINPSTSGHLRSALQKATVEVILGDDITTVQENGSSLSVKLKQGAHLEVDIVLNAIGLIPHPLGPKHGLRTDRGIVVDRQLQTSEKNIYALGDGAQYEEGWLPFVMPITYAAKVCAQALLGLKAELSFPPMPVVVKTAAFPLVVGTSNAKNLNLAFTESAEGCCEEWRDEQGQLRAFVLGGHRCADKATFLKAWKP